MKRHTPAAAQSKGRSAGHVVGAALGLSALLALLVTAFAWPATNSEPRGVQLAVAGPAEATAPIAERLAQERPGAFEVITVADPGEAERLIEDRSAYGAIIVTARGLEVLTASAASPAVEQLLTGLAAGIGASSETPVTVTDVVPTTTDDPRGAGLPAGSLPLVLAGIVTAAALTFRFRSIGIRVAGALGMAAMGALATAAILQPWLGSLDGSYWANSGVLALGIAAIAITLIGLGSVFGIGGLGLGAAVMIMLGNPLSGLTSAPEMLPEGWGTLGQLLPPGALGSALRSVAFFDGAGSGSTFAVLSAWLVLGLTLCLAGAMRQRRTTDAGSTTPVPIPAQPA